MNEASASFDPSEKAIFTDEVSDEALEAAACTGPGNVAAFTVVMCTGQLDCPF